MSPELITAVAERIKTGHAKETIYAELRQAGYTDNALDKVWQQATDAVLDNVWAPSAVKQSTTKTAAQQSAMPASAVVPTVQTLVSNGFTFVAKYPFLTLLLAASSILYISFSGLYELFGPSGPNADVVSGLGSSVLFVVYLVLTFSALYTIVHSVQRSVSLGEALAWTGQHIWGLIWVSLLMTAVVLGGYIFLIIPGLILSVLLLFSQFAYISEGKRGLDALLRSRDLVKSAPWPIVRAYILVILLLILFYFVALLLVSLIGLFFDSAQFTLITGQVISAVGSLVMLHVTMQLYRSRSVAVSAVQTTAKSKGAGLYIGLAIFGAVIGLGLIGSTVIPQQFLPEAMQSDIAVEDSVVFDAAAIDCADNTDAGCVTEVDAKTRANELRNQQ